jgi:Holliday junction resolvase RusA-like endonuclease
MKITIPLVPKPQARSRFSTRGGFAKAYKSKEQRTEEEFIMFYLKEHVPAQPIQTGVKLKVICYMPIPKSTSKKKRALMEIGQVPHIKKPDLDNLLKNIMDCMTKMQFWKDDRQVFDIHIVKRYEDNLSCRWEVELETIT